MTKGNNGMNDVFNETDYILVDGMFEGTPYGRLT
jgi:hypothetical protein